MFYFIHLCDSRKCNYITPGPLNSTNMSKSISTLIKSISSGFLTLKRSLVGMIHKVGIISADNHQQVPFAHMYTRIDDIAQVNAFKQTFSIDVDIEFVGLW